MPSYSVINSSLDKHRVFDQDCSNLNEDYEMLSLLENRDIISTSVISPCSEKIIGSIAGFVCRKLKKSLKCEECCQALFSQNTEDFHDLIIVKKRGNLSFPSKDTFSICYLCEKIFREKIMNSTTSRNSPNYQIMLFMPLSLEFYLNFRAKLYFPI